MRKLLATLLVSSFSLPAFAAQDTDGLFDSWLHSGKDTVVSAPGNFNDAVFSGGLYIVDTSKPIEFTFVFSESQGNVKLEVATLFANNSDSVWQTVFKTVGDSVYQGGTTTQSYTYTYNLPRDPIAVQYGTPDSEPAQIVLRFTYSDPKTGEIKEQWSGMYPETNKDSGTDHMVVFYDYANGQALVGFEETRRYPANMPAGNAWKDYDDLVVLISNVNNGVLPPTPAIPEPESWAMLLAGLGMVGITARRRRRWNK